MSWVVICVLIVLFLLLVIMYFVLDPSKNQDIVLYGIAILLVAFIVLAGLMLRGPVAGDPWSTINRSLTAI